MRLSFFLGLLAVTLTGNAAFAQTDSFLRNGYQALDGGLLYKVIDHGNNKRTPHLSDHIEMHIHVHVGDSIIFDSRQMNNNKPVPFQITEPKFEGDPVLGFMHMTVGDSAVFRLPVASMKKSGNQLLPWMQDSQYVEYNVVLLSLMSDKEQKEDQEKKSAQQKKIDRKLLADYYTKNHIKEEITETGLGYYVQQWGKGELAQAGKNVTVNYTGRLLNGSVFDSNTDPAFKHKEPFTFQLGKGKVIKGWDEGLQLFNKGTKATIYIPSGLAYGSQDRSPSIPANSILIFDIELVDITN